MREVFFHILFHAALLLHGITFSFAQDTERDIPGHQITFSITPTLSDNIKLNNTGSRLLESKPVLGGEAALGFSKMINDRLYLHIGIGYGVRPYYVLFDLYADSPNTSALFSTYLFEYNTVRFLQLPVSLQNIIWKKNNMHLFIEGGGKLSYILPFETNQWQFADLFNFHLSRQKPFSVAGLFIKPGILLHTKPGTCDCDVRRINSWSISLAAHYSPFKAGNGRYSFSNLPVESHGTVKMGINYLGAEFRYGISLKKYKS